MGNLQKKRRTTGKKPLAYRGKSGQNTGTAFPALRLGVVLYLPRSHSGTLASRFAKTIPWTEEPRKIRRRERFS